MLLFAQKLHCFSLAISSSFIYNISNAHTSICITAAGAHYCRVLNKGKNMIEIITLGEFKIIVNGETVTEYLKASPKKMLLLEYLIVNKSRPVPVPDILDVLYGDNEDAGFEGTLKTLVSRMRKDLSAYGLGEAVVTRRGAYMWNDKLDCKVDIFRLEEICKELEEANSLTKANVALFEEVISLYSDDLLTDSGLSAWISPKVFYYHDMYMKTIYKYINLLNNKKNYSDVIRVCKTALDIDAFESTLNLELMSALLKLGKSKEATLQYQNITKLHYTHLGMKPSDEIIDFYKELLRQDKNAEVDINDICNDLNSDAQEHGAFVCEYLIFKDIYHLHMRTLRRTGTTIYLALVSLHTLKSGRQDPLALDNAMLALIESMQQDLRSGDTISRYGPSQIAALLPAISTFEVGRTVLERIKSSFYLKSKSSLFTLEYNLVELNPGSE